MKATNEVVDSGRTYRPTESLQYTVSRDKVWKVLGDRLWNKALNFLCGIEASVRVANESDWFSVRK